MLTLFLTVAVSIVFSIFATQNTSMVTLHFLDFTLPPLPLYLAVLIPVLLAIVLSTFMQISLRLSSRLAISNQKRTIRDLKRELAEVTKDFHKLELENAKFKTELGEPEDSNSI